MRHGRRANGRRSRELDRVLSDMSGPGKSELWLEAVWLEADCLRHPRWSEVRQLAQAALSAFGWPADLPPEGRAMYFVAG